MARESGSFQGRVELRASELDGWIRKRHAPMRAPGVTGLSSRTRHEPTTGGARADRVGVKRFSRAIVERCARWRKPLWPLARETSTGVASDRYGLWSVAIPELACEPPGMARPHPESEHEGDLLRAHGDQAIGSTCSRIVLVAEVDERRSALANPKDLAPLATGETWRHTRSERAPEAGSRWQSRENGGGLSRESTRQMEGALVR